MKQISILVLGRMQIYANRKELELCKARKALELLCYLILRDSMCRSRELIASELWPYNTTDQSRAYLRRAIWQLRHWLDSVVGDNQNIVRLENDALSINSEIELHTDISEHMAAATTYEDIKGCDLTADDRLHLENVVSNYRGDLLENWYSAWIENYRDELKSVQFTLLDKIIEYCVANRMIDKGLLYCGKILSIDAAREKSHRAKMLLLYNAGRRIDALRQYEQCSKMLSRDFSIAPSSETEKLRKVIVNSSDAEANLANSDGRIVDHWLIHPNNA